MKQTFTFRNLLLAVVSLMSGSVYAQDPFTLQILHSSDMEAGLAAIKNAPHFTAIVDSLERTYTNTLKLSGGDNFIPSPFLNASSDVSVRSAIQAANAAVFNDADGTSLFRENYARPDITLMNLIGFHASAVGNHEFDLGPNVFADAIRIETSGPELRWAGVQFPYLSSNLDFSDESALSYLYTSEIRPNTDYHTPPSIAASTAFNKKIAPATIVTVNGEKIGVVGATTQMLESISSVGGVRVKGLKANDMEELATYIQPVIDDLINNHGINKIILLSHLQQIALEKELVSKLNGVDIIVAAGSHTLQADDTDVLRDGDTKKDDYPTISADKSGKPALVVSTDGEWKYVGRLVVDFDANGDIDLASLNPAINGAYAADSMGVVRVWGDYNTAFSPGTKGKVAADLTNAINDVIIQQDGNIFGKTTVFLEGRRNFVRTEETNFGNLTADANLWYARQIDPTVMVSVKNGGGIRSAIGEIMVNGENNQLVMMPPQANPAAGKEEGDISQLDILNALRFNNGLTLVSVTPAQLLQTMNHAFAAWAPTATPGQFPQIAGMRVRFNPELPAGNRVTEIVIVDEDGKILDVVVQRGKVMGDPERLIRVVSLNFLVDQSGGGPNGGDGYPFNAFVLENPAKANKVFITKSNNEPKTGNATFANDGSEQDVLAEYLFEKYKTTPYTLKDTSAIGDRRIQNLAFMSDFFPSTEKTVIYTQGEVKVINGGFGSDMTLVPGKTDEFYMLTDRGPNADSASSGSTKIFSNPEFAPQIGKFVLHGDSIKLVEKITLKRADGSPLTGLPNPVGMGSTGERARDLNMNLLETDPEGIDSEGIVAMPDGSFWISDEYGPHLLHVDAEGKTIERINPFGTGTGGRTIPAVFAKRRVNRGMEGLTITPDGKYLVGIMQSTMHNPSNSGLNARTTRILFYNIETGSSKQYLYRQEFNNNSNSGIVAVTDKVFIVLERDGDFQGGTSDAQYKRFYIIDISNATDVSDPANGANGLMFGGKTIEQLTDEELAANNIMSAAKVLISDLLTDIPFYPHDKQEGFAIINDSTIVVINDDDFTVTPDLNGGYVQKLLPYNHQVDNNVLYYVQLREKLTDLGMVTGFDWNMDAGLETAAVSSVKVYPNPASEVIYFSQTVTGVLMDIIGNEVKRIKNADDMVVTDLSKGIYLLKTDKNEVVKITIK